MNKMKLLMFGMFFCLIVLFFMSMYANNQTSVRAIKVQDAKQMMEKQSGTVMLDVRHDDEFKKGHIPNAVWLENESITAESAAKVIPSKDTPVIVYCRTGKRSAEAAHKLSDLGYKKVYNMGGIIDWPYDIEGTI